VKVKVTNHLWVAADVQIIIATGASQQVFRLVTSEQQATAFGRKTANSVKDFVERRVNNLNSDHPVQFRVMDSTIPKGLWVVYGVQELELDSES
jgi:hypothetical protein